MARDLNVDHIKKLWVLDLIIHCGSLRKAALQAKVSPSAISQTLTSLEHSVGKPLLVRERGTVTATEDALAILEVVRPAFAAFDRLKDLHSAPLPQMSWLNFGTYESIAVAVLPGLLNALKRKMPHVRLSLRISRTANLLTMVRKGELCSALVTQFDDIERFYAREVARDRLGLFYSARQPLNPRSLKAIREIGVGTLAPGKDGLPRYFSRFQKQLEGVKPLLLSDSFEALRAAAVSGAMVSVLPARVALRNSDLVEVTPPGFGPERGEHGIYVVSQLNCDREEADFMAAEAGRLMGR